MSGTAHTASGESARVRSGRPSVERDMSKIITLLIAAATVLIDPTLGRIFFELMGIPNLQTGHLVYSTIVAIFLSLIFYDKLNNRNYRPYVFALSIHMLNASVFYVVFI